MPPHQQRLVAWRWRGVDIGPLRLSVAMGVISDALRIRDMEVEVVAEGVAQAFATGRLSVVRRGR